MNIKNLKQYTIGLSSLILATLFILVKYDISLQLKKDLIMYFWSPLK